MAVTGWLTEVNEQHNRMFRETERDCPAVLESSLLWKSIFYIPDVSPKTFCLPLVLWERSNLSVCACVCAQLSITHLISLLSPWVNMSRPSSVLGHTVTVCHLISVILLSLVLTLSAGTIWFLWVWRKRRIHVFFLYMYLLISRLQHCCFSAITVLLVLWQATDNFDRILQFFLYSSKNDLLASFFLDSLPTLTPLTDLLSPKHTGWAGYPC